MEHTDSSNSNSFSSHVAGLQRVVGEVGRSIVGQRYLIERLLVALTILGLDRPRVLLDRRQLLEEGLALEQILERLRTSAEVVGSTMIVESPAYGSSPCVRSEYGNGEPGIVSAMTRRPI